ncbi:uncharacterized protein LOC127846712 [Dreissena polymorpha]|uniref:uncharacterized protein LOC127846712 n=1 Tax=Dreissena polymorpha TaxID=45954 RepID=UPI002264E6C7|nr:uncharacterized protein LOC127846712 [Dreissena polymorpha]
MMRLLLATSIVVMLSEWGEGLRCFICENKVNPACGPEFKSYQYKAHHCSAPVAKCGLQRQPKIGEFIGIVRDCYTLGSMPQLNESDGCHNVVFGHLSFEICLCSTDYCNAATLTHGREELYLCACSIMTYLVFHWIRWS